MPPREPGSPVGRLRALLAERLGMAFDDKKEPLLGEILQQRATQHGLTDRGYLDRLTTAWSAELAALAEALTVNETYFFRNIDAARTVVERITRSLAPGGYLFLGHTDTLGPRPEGLTVHHTHGTFYYERLATPRRAPEPVPPARPRLREQALHLLGRERFGEALALLDAVTGAEADRPETWLLRGCLLAARGDTGRAAQLCGRLLERDALYADAHQLLADCHEGDERHDEAQRHHRIAAQLDPPFAMPRLRLGLLARRLGDRRTAEEELDLAVHLLRAETDERVALFGGGFGRSALIALGRAELAAVS
ncbi:hypothetical protein ACPPVO_40535 [Dactylosporangium sp. McL0621]|uniref:hypothetical protein n=1 Tax=Dactylosporangium sp. McL0621 TaxID=3415678 RepID=UPI003CECA100